MNWLLGILLMIDSNPPTDLDQTATTPAEAEAELSTETDMPVPDIELLMFLAEWDDTEGDQWLDPEIFSQDTEFNQHLDKLKAPSNEKNPDNN